MQGRVKNFDSKKGYGFITYGDGKDVFVHHTHIQMNGFRTLSEGDIVDFEIAKTKDDGRNRAINVQPTLTIEMVKHELSKENLHVTRVHSISGVSGWMAVAANNVIQTSENGMSIEELAEYASIDVEGLVD